MLARPDAGVNLGLEIVASLIKAWRWRAIEGVGSRLKAKRRRVRLVWRETVGFFSLSADKRMELALCCGGRSQEGME